MQIINNAIWLSDKASCRVGISLKHLISRNIKTSTGWPKIWTVLTTIFSLILSNGPIHVPKIYHNKKWKSCFLINNWPKKIKKYEEHMDDKIYFFKSKYPLQKFRPLGIRYALHNYQPVKTFMQLVVVASSSSPTTLWIICTLTLIALQTNCIQEWKQSGWLSY